MKELSLKDELNKEDLKKIQIRGIIMIVLNLELDNLYGFENYKINFSYSKNLKKSIIKN